MKLYAQCGLKTYPSTSGFLNLGTVDFLDWKILCCARLSCVVRVFSSIPGLSSLNVISPAPPPRLAESGDSFDCHNVPGGQNRSCLSTTALNVP